MKNKFLILLLIILPFNTVSAETISNRLSGKIVLSIEENGEAWYINPDNLERYFLGRPADAFQIMRSLGVGISENDFENFKSGAPPKLSGKILLRAENNGESYYVNPDNFQMYFLGRPDDAFRIMRELGLGITKKDLSLLRKFGEKNPVEKNIYYNAPFTSQAPETEWDKPVFQDGCEEASALMAISWARGESLGIQAARKTIIDISNWEKEKFDEFRDISVNDTAIMIREYFSYDNIEVIELKNIEDLIDAKKKGVIIAPMNGRLLGNIYFTPPGPINHMLLITGYNFDTETFTTNDPGTRNGHGYKYQKDILFDAIRDYPTGYHLPNNKINKNVILVKK